MTIANRRSRVLLIALLAAGLACTALGAIPVSAGAGSDPSTVKEAVADFVTMRMEPGGFAGNVGDTWDATVVIKTKFSQLKAFKYDCCTLSPRSPVAQKGEVHKRTGVLRPGTESPISVGQFECKKAGEGSYSARATITVKSSQLGVKGTTTLSARPALARCVGDVDRRDVGDPDDPPPGEGTDEEDTPVTGDGPADVQEAAKDVVRVRMDPAGSGDVLVGEEFTVNAVVSTNFSEKTAIEFDCCLARAGSGVEAGLGPMQHRVLTPSTESPFPMDFECIRPGTNIPVWATGTFYVDASQYPGSPEGVISFSVPPGRVNCVAIPDGPVTATDVPRLDAISAIFVPPDPNNPGPEECTPTSNVKPCTTYYRVGIPKDIGRVLEVKWGLEGELCGEFTDQQTQIFRVKGVNTYEARWTHPHPHQGGDCADEYPHPGRTIIATVTAKHWVCTAVYDQSAAGTEYPDISGLRGPAPDRCTNVPKKKN